MEKLLLVENNRVEPTQYKRKNFLNESEQKVLVSEQTGEKVEYKAKAIYTFPISRPNKENLNGRIYNNKLWENTIERLKGVSTYGLMDHPKTEGSTKDIWCVWRNLRFNEKKDLIVADSYLVGSNGQDVLEALEAGGPIGLSTSGFGEFLEDKKTINPDSFELERVADFVFNPSYEIFGSQKDLISKKEEVKKDIEMKKNEKIKNNLEESQMSSFKTGRYFADVNNGIEFYENATIEEIVGEENVKDVKVVSPSEFVELVNSLDEDTAITSVFKATDKIHWENLSNEYGIKEEKPNNKGNKKIEDCIAKSFKSNLALSFKQSKKIENVKERISSFEDLLTYVEDGVADDLKIQIKEEIALEKEKMEKKAIDENTDLINGLKEEVKNLKKENLDLNEKVHNATELLDSLKVYSNKLKEMYEIKEAEVNGRVSAEEYRESQIYITQIEKELEESKEERSILKKELLESKQNFRKERNYYNENLKRNRNKIQEEVVDDDIEEIEEDYSKVPKDIMAYYNDLEYSDPKVVAIKKDILEKRTMMEAQKTYMRLKGLISKQVSSYDRKEVRNKNTFVETTQKLPRKEGWV